MQVITDKATASFDKRLQSLTVTMPVACSNNGPSVSSLGVDHGDDSVTERVADSTDTGSPSSSQALCIAPGATFNHPKGSETPLLCVPGMDSTPPESPQNKANCSLQSSSLVPASTNHATAAISMESGARDLTEEPQSAPSKHEAAWAELHAGRDKSDICYFQATGAALGDLGTNMHVDIIYVALSWRFSGCCLQMSPELFGYTTLPNMSSLFCLRRFN